MTKKDIPNRKDYHPDAHPGKPKTQPMKNVCSECHYHNDHSPTCPKRSK